MLARNYWMNVPKDMVDLDKWGIRSLTNTGLSQECGSVGCVAGWLQTMPEFREYKDKAKIDYLFADDALAEWLGMTERITFALRKNLSIPQWEEGLQRLDALVKEAEDKVKEEMKREK
jgi:hypothetical protein